MDVIVTRCAGLDVHKNTVMACVRVPGPDGVEVLVARAEELERRVLAAANQ